MAYCADGVHLSIKAKLVLAASARQELKGAMEKFNRACNTLSELAFQLDLHRRYDICSTSIRFTVVLPQLEMLPKKNAPHHSQAFSIKANSY